MCTVYFIFLLNIYLCTNTAQYIYKQALVISEIELFYELIPNICTFVVI